MRFIFSMKVFDKTKGSNFMFKEMIKFQAGALLIILFAQISGLKYLPASCYRLARNGIFKFMCTSHIYVQWRSKYLSGTIACIISNGRHSAHSRIGRYCWGKSLLLLFEMLVIHVVL